MESLRNHRRWLRLSALVAALGSVLGAAACTSSSSNGASGGSGSSASSTSSGESSGSGSGSGSVTAGANDLQTAYENTVKAVLPSVVQITAGDSLGSGIVYDDKGDIVTNAHVIGSATSFQVTLANSSATMDASLVATYPTNDLAVIKLKSVPSGLKPAAFADSSKVQVGQIVMAMGNPLGLSSSVTQGIVSAVGRTVSEARSSENPQGATIPNMVQTSAAINPGNSGGALVNLNDEVVGINTLAAVDSSQSGSSAPAPGIGFAIPASSVTRLADQMIKSGKVTDSGRAALGVSVRTVLTGSGTDQTGVGVVSVTSGGPAAKAGLQPGDIITKVAGKDTATVGQLSEVLATLTPGQQTQVTYLRGGASKTVTVTLGTL